MDNKQHIDQLFKSVVENYELKPSADVWNRIEEDLNQNKTTHTSASLVRYAAILLVIIAVTLFALPISKNTPISLQGNAIDQNQPIVALSPSNTTSAIITSDNNTVVAQVPLTTNRNIIDDTQQSNLNTFASNTIPFHNQESDFIFMPQETEDESLAAANRDIIDRIYNNDQSIDVFAFGELASYEDDDEMQLIQPDNAIAYKDYSMRGVYIGASGSYNQTSIIEYGNTFKGARPIQPSLKFGSSKGLMLGYNFNNKFGIEAEFIYNAIQGQNYVMSEDEQIVEKSLSLNYDLIPVVAKIKVGRISNITNLPVVLNYTAGIQYGMLREARLPQDKRYEETTEELFTDQDLSVVLGLEYDIFMQENLMLTLGTRGAISTDISTHSGPLSYYNKRNFVFGLRAGLSYAFN